MQISSFLPGKNQGHILITTQTQNRATDVFSLKIGEMEVIEGALLLLRRAKLLPAHATVEAVPASMLKQAILLTEILGGFPSALDRAAQFIEETACSLSECLEHYRGEQRVRTV